MRRHDANPRNKTAPAIRWTAALCAVAIWVMGLLAVSPQLHAALHSDADQADHVCAITLFGHATEVTTGSTCLASAPVFFVEGTCPVQPAMPVAEAHHRLPPACGPPRS